MKNLRKISLIGLAVMMFLGVINFSQPLFAMSSDIDHSFSEELSEDKTESMITLTIPKKEGIRVTRVTLPDKTEYVPESDGDVTVSYKATENKIYDYTVVYERTEAKAVETANDDAAATAAEPVITEHSVDISFEETSIEAKAPEVTEPEKALVIEKDKKTEQPEPNIASAKSTLTNGDIFEWEGWKFKVIDADTNSVAVLRIDVAGRFDFGSAFDGSNMTISVLGISLVDTPDMVLDQQFGAPVKSLYIDIPESIDFNGVTYTVKELADGVNPFLIIDSSVDSGQFAVPIAQIELPETLEKINYQSFLGFGDSDQPWIMEEIVIPDSVIEIDGENFISLSYLRSIKLSPNTIKYGADLFSGNIGIRNRQGGTAELIFPEGSNDAVMDGVFMVDVYNFSKVVIPKNIKEIRDTSFSAIYDLKTFEIWNTTALGGTQDFTANNADAVYLLKSDNALDLANDATYKTMLASIPVKENLVYGMTEVKTTSDTIQTLTKGKSTTFDVNVEAKIGNATTDTGNTFDKSWIDTGYTYEIAGNSDASTKMDGDKLTIGTNETATQLKVKAVSKFDTSKSIEFTINVEKEYVAQVIYYGDYSEGEVLAKFETLQEAFDYTGFRSTSNQIPYNDIEILTDITLDSTVTMSEEYQKTRYIRTVKTAPSSNHTARGNPGIYTGSNPDGRAIISRGANNHGALLTFSIPSNANYGGDSIANLVFDGGMSNGLSGDSLIVLTSTSFDNVKLKGKNIDFINNKNDQNNGGAIRSKDNGRIGNISLTDVTIENCKTNFSGGAIYASMMSANLSVDNSSIKNCYAKENGGGIALGGKSTFFGDGTFTGNKADGNGGALFVENGNINFEESTTITNNEAGLLGAGVYLNPTEKRKVMIYGSYYTGISEDFIMIMNDNVDAKEKGNIYLGENARLSISGTLNDHSTIGVTLAGEDENGGNRMEPGAIIGEWESNIDSSNGNLIISNRNSLQYVHRDTNDSTIGYVYSDKGDLLSGDENSDETVYYELVWPESPMSFKKVDNADTTVGIENAEFTLYKCNDNSHDHSSDVVTKLVKDSDCWTLVKTITSDADGNVDFGDLSTGQYMLVESSAPAGYKTPEGQWFINVNNSPDKQAPQRYLDRLSVIGRGTVLPPNLILNTDDDGYFKSGQISNAALYQLHFDANTGTGTMSDVDFIGGDNVTLPANAFIKDNYDFDGWNTEADGSGTAYADNASINNMSAASMTLYAQWKVQGPSVLVAVPTRLELKDDTDGYAKVTDKVSIVNDPDNEQWWEDKNISIRTATSITLTNIKTSDSFIADVFKADGSQYTDAAASLMVLNPKHDDQKSADFMLKTRINHLKSRELYDGIMRFIIQFE